MVYKLETGRKSEGKGDRLTVCGAVLKHKSLVTHHHEGRAVDTSSHCGSLLSCIVLRCWWCCALVQFVDLLVQVSHVLNAGKRRDGSYDKSEMTGVR